MNQPQMVENAHILIANTPIDTYKIKVFGSRVKVDYISNVAEIELTEKEKIKDKVDLT
jgi:T-complex protein 1 subunit beta